MAPLPGAGKPRLIVVYDNPSRIEEKIGLGKGPGGQLLFEELGIKREEVYQTAACLCRGDSEKENEKAAECCRPRLLAEIRGLDKGIPILSCGRIATHSVLNTKRLMFARGFIWETPPIEEKLVASAARKAGRTHTPVDGLKHATLQARADIAGRVVVPTLNPNIVVSADPWRPVLAVDSGRILRIANGEINVNNLRGRHRVSSGIEERFDGFGESISCDIETTGIDPTETDMLCVGVSDGERTVVVYPWRPECGPPLSAFMASRKSVCFHNGYSFDQIVLRRHGVDLTGVKLDDTLIGFHSFASHLPKRLDNVVSLFVDSWPWKIKFGRRGNEEKGQAPSKMNPEDLCFYNAEDARLTALAWQGMKADLDAERVVYEHDLRLAALCREMQIVGIKQDESTKRKLSEELRSRADDLMAQMKAMVGEGFNPQVPNHLRRALFSQYGAPLVKPTKTGLAATDKEVLTALANVDSDAGRLAKLVTEWRYVSKLRSTFVEGVKVGEDGRVHASWKSFGTVSGRLACRNPNLMNIPRVRRGLDPREMYVAKEGCKFVYFDVGQAEMRFAAYLSGDKKAIEEVESSDCYVAAAKRLFANIPEAVRLLNEDPKGKGKNFRQLAKTSRLAANYLITPDNLYPKLKAEGVAVDLRGVGRVLDKIHSEYSTYFSYVDSNVELCKRQGFIEDPILGRKRRLGFYPSASEVANYPIQAGIAAEMNRRLLQIDEVIIAPLVAQIHDAGLYETPIDSINDMEDLIRVVWSKPVELKNGVSFILPVEIKVGERLSDFE